MSVRRATGPCRWEGVEVRAYKGEATHFAGVTRQVLFEGSARLPGQWRYFEVAPGGYTSLERHAHVHAVMVVRGSGAVLVGREVHPLAPQDLVEVPPLTWHQFRATGAEPLGFLCLVAAERDLPQHPDATQLAELRRDPAVAAFIRTGETPATP